MISFRLSILTKNIELKSQSVSVYSMQRCSTVLYTEDFISSGQPKSAVLFLSLFFLCFHITWLCFWVVKMLMFCDPCYVLDQRLPVKFHQGPFRIFIELSRAGPQ